MEELGSEGTCHWINWYGILSQGCQATTVHALAGLLDARFSKDHLKSHVRTDESWEETRREISTCQTLIVDEASMLSSRIFEQVLNKLISFLIGLAI